MSGYFHPSKLPHLHVRNRVRATLFLGVYVLYSTLLWNTKMSFGPPCYLWAHKRKTSDVKKFASLANRPSVALAEMRIRSNKTQVYLRKESTLKKRHFIPYCRKRSEFTKNKDVAHTSRTHCLVPDYNSIYEPGSIRIHYGSAQPQVQSQSRWWTKWHWDTLFCENFKCAVSVIIPSMLHVHTTIIREAGGEENDRPIGRRSSTQTVSLHHD
jgi:hypothetical protein